MKSAILLSAMLLQSCTYMTYTDSERSFRVVDFHPGGEAISVQAALDDLGAIEVNREQGSSADILDAAAALGL